MLLHLFTFKVDQDRLFRPSIMRCLQAYGTFLADDSTKIRRVNSAKKGDLKTGGNKWYLSVFQED